MRPLLPVLALVALASGCSAPPAAGGLVWTDCGDGLECARLRVPLDYSALEGERLSLGVVRLPASGRRIGSLVVNPGGPGVSGIEYARAARSAVDSAVRERFDIVGFDPRGVGESSPVKCLSDARLDAFLSADPTPDSASERAHLERVSKEFADGCRARSGRLLAHVGTADTARDLESLRQALGDARLTYLGKSYGTFLGATYADMYPNRVRAMVLDGAIDPAVPRLRLAGEQAAGFELALRTYIQACLAEQDCPFRSHDLAGALAEVSSLLRRTDSHPLPSTAGLPQPTRGAGPESGNARKTGEALATLGLLTPLYDRNSWPELTETLRQALAGNGDLLLRNADNLAGRRDDGTYTNQTEANMAITCADAPYPRTPAAYATAGARAAPRFGPSLIWSYLPCAYWPTPPTLTNKPPKAHGVAPILIIGTTRDPATPYRWSQSLANELESAHLLTYDGDGHTAYTNGSPCVDSQVDTYLLTATAPPDGTICPGIG
ncbi:alpha/beta hydrolase [Nonomuraea sp. NPDC050536]|uniref:alpha/beta hydrolase n=1 Tax=Nonomuraea sp. NPDC050536 TaxID=3364366 RepID=UPI0037C6B3B0